MKIALISMPFHSIHRPNLAIGILKEVINSKTDSKCFNHDLNVLFAAMVERELGDLSKYFLISDVRPNAMIGEFIFSKYVEGKITDEHIISFVNTLIEQRIITVRVTREKTYQELIEVLKRLIEVVDQFMDKVLKMDWLDYDIIGFSVTFQQLMPSLALAAEIKKRWPEITIVFGGNTVHSNMGRTYSKKYGDIVDTVFIGEGEEALTNYIKSFHKSKLPKVVMQQFPTNLNTNPVPDFDDYFRSMDELLHFELMKSNLIYEFSRGCWWGQKKKCSFCGLNCEAIDYRYKNLDKSYSDVKALVEKYTNYGARAILLTDNIIPHTYYGHLFRFGNINTKFYFETKSNFNRDEHFKEMVKSGFVFSQPGIESLSDNTLKHINKGVTALQNIKFLIQCRNYNTFVSWNIIFGFLEETDEDIINQIDIINKIKHLQPPMNVSRFRLDRYSEYFDNHAKELSMVGIQKMYNHIFRETVIDEEMCYYFDYEFNPISEDIETKLKVAIEDWQKNSRIYKKEIRHDKDGLYLFKYDDNGEHVIRLSQSEQDLVRKTQNIIDCKKVIDELTYVYPYKDIKSEVSHLIDKDWIITTNGKLLFVGIDRT